MAKAVLDASALLAFLNGETGGEQVAHVIGDAIISAVNFAEVVTRLVRSGVSIKRIVELPAIADLDVVPFNRALSEETGLLITQTGSRGLSLGDRACLALAKQEGLPAYTADRSWSELGIGIEVQLIR